MDKKFTPLVTTSRNEREIDRRRAGAFAEEYGGEFSHRKDRTLEGLVADGQDVVIFEKGMPALLRSGMDQPLYFHLNMAALRLDRLEKGGRDRFLEVAGVLPGMTVLDGTLGLGSDALTAAFQVGEGGKVTAIEGSRGIFSMMKFSFDILEKENIGLLAQLIRRISIRCGDFKEIASQYESESFDVVYLDPMFDKPRAKSDGIDPLRFWAKMKKLDAHSIEEGLRVSKGRLVIKEPKASRWWIDEKFDFPSELTGQRYQSVRYRILKKENP